MLCGKKIKCIKPKLPFDENKAWYRAFKGPLVTRSEISGAVMRCNVMNMQFIYQRTFELKVGVMVVILFLTFHHNILNSLIPFPWWFSGNINAFKTPYVKQSRVWIPLLLFFLVFHNVSKWRVGILWTIHHCFIFIFLQGALEQQTADGRLNLIW